MTLSQAEEQLLQLLGTRYNDEDWRPALKAVMDAEGDVIMAQEAIRKISVTSIIEDNLMGSVQDLQRQNRIIRKLPSIEDLVNPAQKQEIEDSPHAFLEGDKDIVNQVVYEDDGDEEKEEDPDVNITHCDAIRLIATLERLTLKFGGDEMWIADTLELTHQLRKFHGFLNSEERWHGTQTYIDSYFTPAI
ncbi:hypothetical protein BGW80DRAFT_1466932 [Lactifluus volemus]|nr:hypothetical protein BGW80DRAFT_1466932 [Lactifluus volemus]